MPRLRVLKHELFCQYIADGVPQQEAWRLSGHLPVQQSASRMACKPEIRARIAEIIAKHAYKSGEVSKTRIMTELARIGFSDIRKVASWVTREELVPVSNKKAANGMPQPMATKRVTELIIFNSDTIDDDTAAAIQSITRKADGTMQIKFYDKHAALLDMGREMGMFTERLEVGNAGDFAKLNDEELERFIRAKVVSLSPLPESTSQDEDFADGKSASHSSPRVMPTDDEGESEEAAG